MAGSRPSRDSGGHQIDPWSGRRTRAGRRGRVPRWLWLLTVPGLIFALLLTLRLPGDSGGGLWDFGDPTLTGSDAETLATQPPVVVVPSAAPYREPLLAFVSAWANPDRLAADAWLESVRPYATEELLTGLAETDPSVLPGGRPDGRLVVRESGPVVARVEVGLGGVSGTPDGSGSLLVACTVVFDGSGWKVAEITPGGEPR